MDYRSRILGYLLNPLAIEPTFGLSEYLKFWDNTELQAKGSTLPSEIYARTIEESRPYLFSVENDTVKPLGQTNDISSVEEQVTAVINLKGTMLAEGGLCTYGIDRIVRQVNSAAANTNVNGIIIRTHSGGGEVVAAQRLGNAVKNANEQKPVIQFVDGVSASGALWVGVNAQEIHMAGDTTSVGSIGVVIQLDKRDIADLRDNLLSIFADGSEDKQNIFKAILSGDHDFVKRESLNPIRDIFVKTVQKGRATARKGEGVSEDVFTGKMFRAKKAIKLGLADRKVNGIAESIKRVNTLVRSRKRAAAAGQAIKNLKK